MNKLILKLFTKSCYHGDYEPENVPNAVVEKFAELIVRECAAIASNTNLEDVDGGDSAVLGAARGQILEHFGVKE